MNTRVLKINSEKPQRKIIKITVEIIEKGGIIIFPTETVYGIGTLMNNKKAISQIYQLRKRPKNKALLILIAQKKDLKKYARDISSTARKIINKFWPGPLTLIFKKNKKVPNFVTAGKKTIAIRMPENKFLLALIKKLGQPIVAPSANLSGKKPPLTAKGTFKDFFGKVDLILDGGLTKYKKESTILDLTQRSLKIIRMGGISKKVIEKFLRFN